MGTEFEWGLLGVFAGGAFPWLEAIVVIPAGIFAGLPVVPVVIAGAGGNLLTVGIAAYAGEENQATMVGMEAAPSSTTREPRPEAGLGRCAEGKRRETASAPGADHEPWRAPAARPGGPARDGDADRGHRGSGCRCASDAGISLDRSRDNTVVHCCRDRSSHRVRVLGHRGGVITP